MVPDNGGNTETIRDILDYVLKQRGIDFSGFRASTIRRRLAFRLQCLEVSDYASYRQVLYDDPPELDALVEAFSIKASSFFRNPLVFEVLHDVVLPELIDDHQNDTLRVWCAGCARGEEAYSVAILLKELFGEASRLPLFFLATDIDQGVLDDARRATYREESLGEVKKRHLEAWFRRADDRYALSRDITDMVTFARHDVTAEGPPKEGVFSDYHLILCRNVLIYFDRELQASVLRQLSSMVRTGGFIVLGEAETMRHPDFAEVVPTTRVFRKGGRKT